MVAALGQTVPAVKPTIRLEPSAGEEISERIDRYKLLQKLGEGGCGVVYMTEQTEPVRRRVALKVIKLGMDTRQVIARFEAERQALALMDHPNIAKVLDAGTTEQGRPYFVMELVKGVRITEYCDQNHLSTPQRLELFAQVCQAVQHAHQKGIIHRDIKPSNILVTLHDGVPVPKVIDFGIAKATEQALTEKTVFTAFGQFMGTPAYMSPEQAELSGLDIDTRSDIYALGVLLYELLTGKTPFDAQELLQAGLDEMRRRIREEEPMRPSTRLSTMAAADLTQVAQQRHVEPAKLTRFIRGDLDWIVMKCLEKDRRRRYETANGLATDIKRHLTNEPVVACPPSTAYRFQKLIRRNKLGVAAVAAVLAALVMGLSIAAWQYFEKSKAYNRAVAAEKLAERNARAEEVQRTQAEANAVAEQRERQRAEKLAEDIRVNLYAARIKLAEQAYKDGDVARALQYLDSLQPQSGQTELRSFDWHYLRQLCHSERLTLNHKKPVFTAAFSQNSDLVATAGEDAVVRLWNATNGLERAQLTGHTGTVAVVVFSPDGKTLASAGVDGIVRLWDLASTRLLKQLPFGTSSFTALAFSPDGNHLVAGEGIVANNIGNPSGRYAPSGTPGRILVWNLNTFELARTLDAHRGGVRALAFSPDGRTLASGGIDRSVKRIELATGRVVANQTNFSGFVFGVAFSADGHELAVSSWFPFHESGEIKVLDAATLEEKRILVANAGRVTCLTSSPDRKGIATAGVDHTARLWEFETGNELMSFHGHTAPIAGLAFDAKGESLVTSGWDAAVKLWDLSRSPVRQRIPTPQSYSVAFSPDGNLLACAGTEVELREARSGKLVASFPEFKSNDLRLLFSDDGRIVAAGGFHGRVGIFDVPGRRFIHQFTVCTNPLAWLAWAPDRKTLVTSGGIGDTALRCWNTEAGVEVSHFVGSTNSIARLPIGSNSVPGLIFRNNGRQLITGGWREMRLWDVDAGILLQSFPGVNAQLAVSPNERFLAARAFNNAIRLRDVATLEELAVLAGHKDGVLEFSFSHDNRLLASASWDGTVKLWQVTSGQELLTIPSRSGVVWCVAFSPDDRNLAFGSGSNIKGSGEVTILRAPKDFW